jgi:hypothetical protein
MMVGNGVSMLFWIGLWFEGAPLCDKFRRLFELSDSCLVFVVELKNLGWEVDGDGRIWWQRLLAWEDEHVGESSDLMYNILLQVK